MTPATSAFRRSLHFLLTCLIAAVWLVNGLFCKVIGLVPRHEAIVARILGENDAPTLTFLIGLGEILFCIWIISGIQPKICALCQALLVAVMNLIEFFLAPDLLLFGKLNIVFAGCFMVLVLLHGFFQPAGARYPLSFLQDHPFPVETRFRTSLVLTYALPKEQLQKFLPPFLEPDTYNDETGFIAIALVDTKDLRPKGFPRFMGHDFILAGYRIFTRYTNRAGKRWRGLYILRSETNKKKMELLGNIFTRYGYTTSDISMKKEEGILTVWSVRSGIKIRVRTNKDNAGLPAGSPFRDGKEARRFAGPLPFTFTCLGESKQVLIVEGVRSHWEPQPVEVLEHEVGFLNDPRFKEARLANAFIMEDVPYYWKKGKKERWNP